MLGDTTDFIKWGIESGIVLRRPDLSLTYYPSVFDFYWFVARNLAYLKGIEDESLRFPELVKCKH